MVWLEPGGDRHSGACSGSYGMEAERVQPGAQRGLWRCFPWLSLSRALPGTRAAVLEIGEMEFMLLGL